MNDRDMEEEMTQGEYLQRKQSKNLEITNIRGTGRRSGFSKGGEERVGEGARELCPGNQRRQTLKEESGTQHHKLVPEVKEKKSGCS